QPLKINTDRLRHVTGSGPVRQRSLARRVAHP
ncbi:unnamed protein product, partial [marine sediment metagenome]